MTTIGSGPDWSAIIRSQLDNVRKAPLQPAAHAVQSAGKHTAGHTAAKPARTAAPAAAHDWTPGSNLLGRLQSLGQQDPDRRRKAFRLFMESVLATEFSAHITGTPTIGPLVDQVILRMDQDPQLHQASLDAADALLAIAKTSPSA